MRGDESWNPFEDSWEELIEPTTHSRRRRAPRERSFEERSPHSLEWPESLAVTTIIGAIAAVASGALDPMLPWMR